MKHTIQPPTTNKHLIRWVEKMAALIKSWLREYDRGEIARVTDNAQREVGPGDTARNVCIGETSPRL
jgi:hypothetical protein